MNGPSFEPSAGDGEGEQRPEVRLAETAPKKLPKGVVLGKDGKPYVIS